MRELPGHIAPLHGYIDSTLGLQQLMESKLKLMTPEQVRGCGPLGPIIVMPLGSRWDSVGLAG